MAIKKQMPNGSGGGKVPFGFGRSMSTSGRAASRAKRVDTSIINETKSAKGEKLVGTGRNKVNARGYEKKVWKKATSPKEAIRRFNSNIAQSKKSVPVKGKTTKKK